VSIESVDKNTVVRIYYKSQNLQSGLSIEYNLWDEDGTALETGTAADGEIGNQGVYFLDFTTPNADLYVFGFAQQTNGLDPAPTVLAVGNPNPTRVFYVDSDYTEGRTIPYEIYDTDGTVYLSGNLTEHNNGFYSADVSSLAQNTTFLFEADGLIASSFSIEAEVSVGFEYIMTGGITLGGSTDICLFGGGFVEEQENPVPVSPLPSPVSPLSPLSDCFPIQFCEKLASSIIA